MENEELFRLRQQRDYQLNHPKELYDFAARFFDKEFCVPLVIGHDDPAFRDTWTVHSLRPYTVSDRLTVENFLEGINEVTRNFGSFGEEVRKRFRGDLFFEGVDNGSAVCEGTRILELFLGSGFTDCSLGIYWIKGLNYSAHSKIHTSPIRGLMEPYIGPHHEERF